MFGRSLGAASTPALGATFTPAYSASIGATTTPAFGATLTPALGSTPTPAFGASSAPLLNFASGPAFGQSISAFTFGATSTFGAQSSSVDATSNPAVGATSTPAFGASSTPSFNVYYVGATSIPEVGSTSTSAFGASSTPSFDFYPGPVFGQSSPTIGSSQFGAASTFGSQAFSFGTQTSTTAFGSPSYGLSASGRRRWGSNISPYLSTPETGVQPGIPKGSRMTTLAEPGTSPVKVKVEIEALPVVTPSNPKLPALLDSRKQPKVLNWQSPARDGQFLLEYKHRKEGDANDTMKVQVGAGLALDEQVLVGLPTVRLYDRISEIMNLDINRVVEYLAELEILLGRFIAEEESGDEIRGLLVDVGLISANYSASNHYCLMKKTRMESLIQINAEHEQLLSELSHLQSANTRLGSYEDNLIRRAMELDIELLMVHTELQTISSDRISLTHDMNKIRSRALPSVGKKRKWLSYQSEVAKSHSMLAARFRNKAERGWRRLTASWSKVGPKLVKS